MEKKGVELIQWHPAFCSAMRLELRANKKDLNFQNEYNLGKKPLQVDLLVVKKADDVRVQNEIGRIFRRYNLLEYKSPEDELGVDEFYKVIAYGCLYKALEEKVGEIPETEITLTIVRDSKPVKLLTWLKNHHYPMKCKCEGIYDIGEVLGFPVQLIVGRELSEENHVWLTSLKKGLNKEQVYNLVLSATGLSEKDDKENADALLDAAVRANPLSFPEVKKEGANMCGALLELMKPELDEARASAKAEGHAEGEYKKLVVLVCKKLRRGLSVQEIADVLEEESEKIQKICDIAKDFAPEYSEEEVWHVFQIKCLKKADS